MVDRQATQLVAVTEQLLSIRARTKTASTRGALALAVDHARVPRRTELDSDCTAQTICTSVSAAGDLDLVLYTC